MQVSRLPWHLQLVKYTCVPACCGAEGLLHLLFEQTPTQHEVRSANPLNLSI
jgi:hypothetical protein